MREIAIRQTASQKIRPKFTFNYEGNLLKQWLYIYTQYMDCVYTERQRERVSTSRSILVWRKRDNLGNVSDDNI